MGAGQVDGDDVRLLAHFQRAGVAAALEPGAVAGGHVQHLGGLHEGGVVGEAVVEDGGQVHLLHHVEVVVAGGAVGAQGHVQAQLQHPGDGGEAAAQLHVAGGVVDGADALFLHEGHVLLRHPDAVGGEGGGVEGAQVVEPPGRSLAVLGHALIVLLLRL